MLYIYKQITQDYKKGLLFWVPPKSRFLKKGGENNGLCKESCQKGSEEEGSQEGSQEGC
jgi:hypothetical protein